MFIVVDCFPLNVIESVVFDFATSVWALIAAALSQVITIHELR